MGAFLSALLEFLSTIFARVISVETLKFIAYKTVLTFLVFSGLLIVWKIIVGQMLDLLYSFLQQYTSSSHTVVLAFSGLAGWLLHTLRIDDCLSVYFSVQSIRLILRMLPFTPVR